MRARRAKLLALATGVLLLLLSIVFAARADEEVRPSIERGKEVYRNAKCQSCHSIGGVGSKRYPLDGVGSKLAADDIRRWIVAPREMNPKVIKPRFDSLSAEDLTALVAYLTSLRSEGPAATGELRNRWLRIEPRRRTSQRG